MIHYYEHLPSEEPRRIGMGVDLAISERQSADCTAMVTAQVHGDGVDMKIYIHPNPINDRLSSLLTLAKARHQFVKVRSAGMHLKIYVENVGYQFATVEHLRAEGIDAEGVPVGSLDKHGRLALNSFMFENGKVLFPKQGCEELIMQLTGFGKEKHDDLVDATTIVVTKLFEFASKAQPRVRYI